MKSTYDICLPLLLAHEGGYTNHPRDPGGPTNFGITIHDYRKYVKPGATAADVRAMALDEAKAIYRMCYWDAQRTDEVLPAVAKRDPTVLVAAINAERLAFLKRLKTWPVFGKGWGTRVAGVR